MTPVFRLVAADVDGTLLDSQHRLTPAVAAAVQAVTARGIPVVLATGKQYVAIRDLVRRLGLTAPQITSHGARITDPTNDRQLYLEGVPRAPAERVIALGAELGVTIILAGDGCTYATADNADVRYMLTYGDPAPQIVPDLTTVLDPPPTHIMGIAYQRDAVYEAAAQRFQAELGAVLNVSRSSPYYLEFLHPQASKGQALRRVCDWLNIPPAAVLALGDSYNDISLFEAAGHSVAMGHSPAAVQQAADSITATNDADGAAAALHRFILDT